MEDLLLSVGDLVVFSVGARSSAYFRMLNTFYIYTGIVNDASADPQSHGILHIYIYLLSSFYAFSFNLFINISCVLQIMNLLV
jgi:hypothetical protein